MAELSEYSVFDGVEFSPEVKELMKLFTEAWEQCRATGCGECHYRHGKKRYSLMACLCERYAVKMLENGYKRVEIDQFKPLTLDDLSKRNDPVFVSIKDFPNSGYWCLCQNGYIIPPSGYGFMAKERPNWVFYSQKTEDDDHE